MASPLLRDDTLPTTTPASVFGFLTDVTLCIGCKACEVACKQWNGLEADGYAFSGESYDNTGDLESETWRHVAFVECHADNTPADLLGSLMRPAGGDVAWLMMSDVCKHCVRAGCLEACPTGAIVRTEFGTVVIQQDVCNGCGYCIPACPFGVPQLSERTGTSRKCTLCYDRLSAGMEPACAQSCPTDSIIFGPVDELRERADARINTLHAQGVEGAHLYGDEREGGTNGIGGLNALFVLTAPPEVFNLPAAPDLPSRRVLPGLLSTAAAALGLTLAAALSLRHGDRRR
jgi:formate dehydrogenase iron-sulfur subunit